MTDFGYVFMFGMLWIAIILVTFMMIRNLKIADHYRKKYGFDRAIESKFFKKEKHLQSQEKAFQRRARKFESN